MSSYRIAQKRAHEARWTASDRRAEIDLESHVVVGNWYVVGDADLVIPPALQLKMAERAKAHISHTNGSHPSMVVHPEATVDAIMTAMSATHTR